jgi:polyhydroxyalkanoate synthesis regulator phasin
MENKEKYYKEVIKSRMYKNAANLWGVRNIDNIDPLIKLLIESLASEINKLSSEIGGIETRLLERIAGLLTPDLLMTVRPAHMILHAQPFENKTFINKNTGFYYETQGTNKISFYPADKFSLVKGDIESIICGRKIFYIESNQSKEIRARSHVRSEKFTNKLWLGLNINPSISSIQNLSFYFDLLNIENKNELLHLLPYTKWEFENNVLPVKSGIHVQDAKSYHSEEPFASYDLANISDDSILKIYNHQFITITGVIHNKKEYLKKIPDELMDVFQDEKIVDTLSPLLWIKVTFPPQFDDYILEDFFVSINAFPVINKRLHTKNFKTDKMVSVIPLDTENYEFVLSMNSVIDSNNRKYMQLPFQSDHSEDRYGTYVVKRGGAERFDARNAREYLSNLIDVLREEGASFAMIGKGFVDELVSRINEQTVTIENKLTEIKTAKDITSYMIIDANEIGEIVYLDYWVTNCEMANDIKTGVYFSPYNETYVNPDTSMSLTQSRGGRRLQANSLDIYKYILTSRDRIYTDEDIINFCFAQFGDVIISAKVKKGVQVSPRPKEGLIRSIDVYLELKNQITHLSSNEGIKDKLLNLLKDKSPETYNYRVFITNQE